MKKVLGLAMLAAPYVFLAVMAKDGYVRFLILGYLIAALVLAL